MVNLKIIVHTKFLQFFVDPNRNYHNVEDLPENLNTTGSQNPDGNPMGMIPMVSGEDANDTANYGAGMCDGNAGLQILIKNLRLFG